MTKPDSTRAALLQMIESYLSASGTQPEVFGWAAIKDASLVRRLREGGDVTTKKLDAIIKYLSSTHRSITDDKTSDTRTEGREQETKAAEAERFKKGTQKGSRQGSKGKASEAGKGHKAKS